MLSSGISCRMLVLMLVLGIVCVGVPGQAQQESTKERLVIGARIGPAIPSPEIANVYNTLIAKDVSTAYETSASLGYYMGANCRIGISNNFSFSGGASFVRFPGQELLLTDSVGKQYNLTTSTIFIPITFGLSWLPIHSMFVPIFHAEAMLDYRKSIVSDGDIVSDFLKPGAEVEPQATRFGAQLGFTLELDLGIRPQIDVSYALTNLIGKKEGELDKNFIMVGVGLIF